MDGIERGNADLGDIFECPERAGTPLLGMNPDGSWPTWDHWVRKPDQSRTCSFCGSLHPQDFVEIMYDYIEGLGARFEPTTKDYKTYASRAGTSNAGQGGIKFYGWHVPHERTELDGVYTLALTRYRAGVSHG